MEVGFVGLGTMGAPMARHLLEAGHQLAVHDLRREASDALIAKGAVWAEHPRDVAQGAEVVFTSLPGPKEVEAVLLDSEHGILAGLSKGAVYIDTTTNSPSVFRRLAGICQERGVAVLDAPISGGPQGAETGKLAIMVGGDEATFARCRPLFESMGTNIALVGGISGGMICKLVVQHLVHAHLLAAAEGLLLGVKAGLDPAVLLSLLQGSSAGSNAMQIFPPLVFSGKLSPPDSFGMLLKDLSLVRELADEVNLPTPALDSVERTLERGQPLGCADAGFLASVWTMEKLAGQELRVPVSRDSSSR